MCLSKSLVRFVRFVRNVRHFANAHKASNANRLITKALRAQSFFAGKDVAEALGYAKPEKAIVTHVDVKDKSTTQIQGTASNYIIREDRPLRFISGIYPIHDEAVGDG
jgi:prophage antirepressor-like protein